jgi:hypothetical protein
MTDQRELTQRPGSTERTQQQTNAQRQQEQSPLQLDQRIDYAKQQHAVEQQQLSQREQRERQNLQDATPGNSQSEAADQSQALERFQTERRQQLEQTQQLERRVLEEQRQASDDLNRRQQLQQDAAQRLVDSSPNLDSRRESLTESQARERATLQDRFGAERRALEDNRLALEAQNTTDGRNMQRTMEDVRSGKESPDALDRAVQQQQDEGRNRQDSVEQRIAALRDQDRDQAQPDGARQQANRDAARQPDQFEMDVRQIQNRAQAEMEARQQARAEELRRAQEQLNQTAAKPDADAKTVADQRKQVDDRGDDLERRNTQERERVTSQNDRLNALLADYRATQSLQRNIEQKSLESLAHGANPDAVRTEAVQREAREQENRRTFLEKSFREQLDSLQAQRAFEGRFSETAALRQLWERCARDESTKKQGFDRSREKFWKAVNQPTDEDARQVRDILKRAGYEFDNGTSNAPKLALKTNDPRKTREIADQRLSIDHAAAQSNDRSRTLDADNLRFMSQRDNSVRRNWFSDSDRDLRQQRSQ